MFCMCVCVGCLVLFNIVCVMLVRWLCSLAVRLCFGREWQNSGRLLPVYSEWD